MILSWIQLPRQLDGPHFVFSLESVYPFSLSVVLVCFSMLTIVFYTIIYVKSVMEFRVVLTFSYIAKHALLRIDVLCISIFMSEKNSPIFIVLIILVWTLVI